MNNLQVGVVGAGVMGSGHIEYLTHHVDGVEVVAVAEPDVQLRDSVLERNGLSASTWDTLEEMLDNAELEGVVIASPDRFHASSVELCISRSIPALCEKPLAETQADAERVHQAHSEWAQAHGRNLVHLGFMRRFDPPYQQAKNIIDSGELGAVLYVNASTRNVSSPEISSNELLTNIAVHELDVMRWLLGAEWDTISVNTPRPTRHGGSGVADPIVLTGSLDSGAFVVADIFANNHYGYDVRTEISLEDGLIRIGVAGDLSVVREHRLPGSEPFDMVDNWMPRFTSAYINELKAWTATLRGEPHSDLATVADGLVAISVLDSLIH